MRSLLMLLCLGAVGIVRAETCTIELNADDAMKFDKAEVVVSPTCKTITISLNHIGKLPVAAMGHNVVIAKSTDVQAVGTAGMTAGAAAHYVPKDDARVIAYTKVIGGGAKTTAMFPGSVLKAGGDYAFFCSFPGHWAIMKGKIVVR